MIETAIALFAAHVFADFLLQTEWIIRNKRRAGAFLAHIILVVVVTLVLLGAWSGPGLLAVAIIGLSHALIDAAKIRQSSKAWVSKHRRGDLLLFLVDQALHFGMIAATAWALPQAWSEGWWSTNDIALQIAFLSVLCLSSGFVLATRTGGFVIEKFMAGFDLPEDSATNEKSDPGLTDGGWWIGLLERSLIFILIMAQQFQAIGFLIAAKSVLRFQYAKERSHSEIVIIGTLASFAWAIATAWGTFELVKFLNA